MFVVAYALLVELEIHPATEARGFIEFARSEGCDCRKLFRENQLTLSVPQARDPSEARRLAMDLITRFSANHQAADVRIVQYD